MAHTVTTRPVTRTYLAAYKYDGFGHANLRDDLTAAQASAPGVYSFWLEDWIDADGQARTYVVCDYEGIMAGAREEVTATYDATPTLARFIRGGK